MTFSILARDESRGQMGVATATHAFGVGAVANHARAGTGAIATQSFIDVGYGPRGLDLLEMGIGADAALDAMVSADDGRAFRQVAIIDRHGVPAHYTGGRCVPSAGAVVEGSAIAIGNMLQNDDVLPAMSDAFHAARGDLAERLLEGLCAADAAGGDARGRMSASMLVVDPERPANRWEGVIHDLRVDYHPDPMAELRTSLTISNAYKPFFQAVFLPGVATGDEPLVDDALRSALDGLDAAQKDLGGDLEPTLWRGILLLRAGERPGEAYEAIARAIRSRRELSRLVDGLAEIGAIPLGADEILARASDPVGTA